MLVLRKRKRKRERKEKKRRKLKKKIKEKANIKRDPIGPINSKSVVTGFKGCFFTAGLRPELFLFFPAIILVVFLFLLHEKRKLHKNSGFLLIGVALRFGRKPFFAKKGVIYAEKQRACVNL